MNKFFQTSTSNSLQLPIAVIVRPLKHSPSTGNLICTGALIRPHNSDIDPILTELPNRFKVSQSELVVQPVVEFTYEQDIYKLWQSMHSTIQTHNPKLACVSTEIFFLFGNPENATDLNSTQQFLESTFKDTQTYIIDYSGDNPKLTRTNEPFESEKIQIHYAKTQDLFFNAFFNIIKQLDQPTARNNVEKSSFEGLCAIL